MEETRRQMLCVAAVALIQPYDVHATRPGLDRYSFHVMRLARRAQAVQHEYGRMLPGVRLPVTMRKDTSSGIDVEISRRRLRQTRKVARIAPAVDRHGMAVPQVGARDELAQRRISFHPLRARRSAGQGCR